MAFVTGHFKGKINYTKIWTKNGLLLFYFLAQSQLSLIIP